MKKFICALLILCLLPITFLASCENGEDAEFSKPVYGACEKMEFTVNKSDLDTILIVKKVVTDKEDIAKITNYVNNAELTFAEDRYTGALFGGYNMKVSFADKDGNTRSFLVSGKMLIDKGTIPFYTDENFKEDLLNLYDLIDAEEQIVQS